MEITVGNIKLTAKYGGIETITITIDVSHCQDNHIFDVDSEELKAAIDALEKTCWRP